MGILIGIISLVILIEVEVRLTSRVEAPRLVDIFRRKVAQTKGLRQEMFLESKIIEKYWTLIEKLNNEIPISTAVLILRKRRRLKETRTLSGQQLLLVP